MRKITIQYSQFKWIKYSRYHTGNFPSEWNETSPKQLIAIACLMKRSISDIQFLSIMTGLSKRIIKKLDDYQRFQLIELFDTFHSDKPYNEFIIEKIDCKNTMLFNPKPKLKNITFGQFIFMDTHFVNYQQSSDITDLNKFIAAVYLPFNERFTEEIIDNNYPLIAKIDLITKEAIAINYHLIRDWLCETYPLVFQKQEKNNKDELSKNREQKTIPKQNNNSWIKILDNIVGDDIINQDKYTNLSLHNTLRYLSEKIKANLKK
ncbi:MAG: hypothetical protein L3J54_01910 [Draconibacterium sp.]|nr:hypothetical protein [Draconibacterium sp.]